MANPTTNYGFVLPTSSDLVTDLPADFDVALQGVDTRLKALQPGTTLGDLAYSSATANTNTRLAAGSTGDVLTVAGGVPTWAAPVSGGMTLISTTTTSTGTAYTLSSIPQTYNSLYIEWLRLGASANGCTITISFAGGQGAGGGATESGAITISGAGQLTINNNVQAAANNAISAWIYGYTDSSSNKAINATYSGVSAAYRGGIIGGGTSYTSAISTLTVTIAGGTYTGGTLKLYGVK
jgi:hypothetical protein